MERAAAEAERRRALPAQGLIAAVEATAAERALAEARAAAERTRAAIARGRHAGGRGRGGARAGGAAAAGAGRRDAKVADAHPLRRRQAAGRWRWCPTLERFFAERFGHPLPVSALGQTAAHDRLGFDHRNAIDVAVHPDSPEGRALMRYLRGHGIPFLAFRGAQRGRSPPAPTSTSASPARAF